MGRFQTDFGGGRFLSKGVFSMRTAIKAAVILVLVIAVSFIFVFEILDSLPVTTDAEAEYNEELVSTDIPTVDEIDMSSSSPITEESQISSETEQAEEDSWPFPITQDEIDLIALVTMAEAEGETELGKRLVIDTILNRVDSEHFPDTVNDVIYQRNQFSSMWNGRVDRCYVMPEIVELVKEELLERTNYDCMFFTAGGYSSYGVPMFQECCHYFSSYD